MQLFLYFSADGLESASESGYATFDAGNSTTDVEEYSSVNVDHSGIDKLLKHIGWFTNSPSARKM
jgi:hypothetical protein